MYPNNNQDSTCNNVSGWETTDEEQLTYTFCHQYFSQVNLFDTYDFGPHTISTNDSFPSPTLPSPPSPTQDYEEDLREFYLGKEAPKDSDSSPGSCSKSIQDFGKIKNDQNNLTNDDLDYKIELINTTRYNSQNLGDIDDLFNDSPESTIKEEEIKGVPAKIEESRNDLSSQIIRPKSPSCDADNLFEDNSLLLSDQTCQLSTNVAQEEFIDPLLQHDYTNMSPCGILLDSPGNFLMDRDDFLSPRFGNASLGYESDGLFGDSGDYFRINRLNLISGNSPPNLTSLDYPEMDGSNTYSFNYINQGNYNVQDNEISEVNTGVSMSTNQTYVFHEKEENDSYDTTPIQTSNISLIPVYHDDDADDDSEDSNTTLLIDEGATKRKRQMKTNYDCRLCGQPRKYHICPYKPRKESDKQLNDRIRRECTAERQRKRVTRTRAGAPLKRYTCKKCGQYKKDDFGRSHTCPGSNSGTQVDQLGIYDKFTI